MKRKKESKRRSSGTKGKLVRGYIEYCSREIFQVAPETLKKYLEDKSGLYALYKGDDLYYVGMSEDIYGRLVNHTHDHHKGRWTYFSAYVIKRVRYIKDLEAIVHRFGERRGNKQIAKFPRDYDIKRKLAPFLRERRKILDRIFLPT